MSPITQSGLIGIQKGMQGMQKAAGEIASAKHFNLQNPEESASGKTLVESIVEMKASSHQVQASAKVVKAADEMIGSILDVLA